MSRFGTINAETQAKLLSEGTVRGAPKEGQKAARMPFTGFFSLPVPPSTNNLFRNAGKKRIKTERYINWLVDAQLSMHQQRVRGEAPNPCKITISISSGKGFREDRDLDNFAKAVLDLLVENGILAGDSVKFVPRLSLHYYEGNEGALAMCHICIEKLW